MLRFSLYFFFFNDTATTEIYTLSLHDALPIYREPPTPDVFRYQWAATERYCAELAGEGTEAAHLSCIVRATGEAHRTKDIHSLAPALFAYAMYLEQEGHLDRKSTRLNSSH